MSELQEISEQIAKLKSDANKCAQSLWERSKTLEKQTAAIHNQLEGTSNGNYRTVIAGLNAAQKQLNKAADDLLVAWQIAADWLERVGGGSSSSAPASGGTAFSGPVQTEEMQRNDGGVSGTGGLTCTEQETERVFLNGRWCNIFDHPFDANPKRICRQGSAYPKEEYPDGPRETCGLCSSGTVVNKAGGNTTERSMIDIAMQNGLCDSDGSTSIDSIVQLLTLMGVDSEDTTGSSLKDLAAQVEQGKCVIIGVDAGLFYDNESYLNEGHALVLESVVRDADTGEIVEFIVVDSNGRDSVDAVTRIRPEKLEEAFRDMGSQSVTTKNIIW